MHIPGSATKAALSVALACLLCGLAPGGALADDAAVDMPAADAPAADAPAADTAELAKLQQAVPDLAFSAEAGYDKIVLAEAPQSAAGIAPCYSTDKQNWQKSRTFAGLAPGTKYTFYVYWPQTDTYDATKPVKYGSAKTDAVRFVKLTSASCRTNAKNISKGRLRRFATATFEHAPGVRIAYRYKVVGKWTKWAVLAKNADAAVMRELGDLTPKKRTLTVQARAVKGASRTGKTLERAKSLKLGAYVLDNIGQLIVERALAYTSPNYYYLMSDYNRYRSYSSTRTTGIDCSGLVSCVLRDLGVDKYTHGYYIVSTDIAHYSNRVSKGKRGAKALAYAKPGDTVYWSTHWIGSNHNPFRHIAIYAGEIDGVPYIIDSYPWHSWQAGYDYCKKLCKNPKVNGKKNALHHGVNLRPLTKREIRQISSINRFSW